MSHEKNSSQSAKQALADYYDDVLGSLSGGAEETEVAPFPLADVSVVDNKGSLLPASAAEKTNAAAKKSTVVETKRAASQTTPKLDLKSSTFAEPAASSVMPTLAPPKIRPATVAPVVESPAEVAVEPKVEVNPTPAIATTEPKVEQTDVPIEVPVDATETNHLEVQQLKKPLDWLANGRPAWAQERFECLLFSVAGLKLAVPLVSLGSIHRMESELTPLVGRADWFIGLYRTGDRNINVVDTAKWVMPRQYDAAVVEGYHFVIRLGDTNWGVACDSVAEAIQLEPDQVRWRTERSKRAWLSGTVIDHMCALLDADMLSYLLQLDARSVGAKKGSGI